MDLRSLVMGIGFAVMWSSAFTTGRMIVLDAPPLHALALRFLVAGIIGVAIAAAMGQTARLTRPQWRATILFGLLQNVVYLGCNFFAMQWVPASLASIIASAMPLVVALAGWLAFGEKMRPLGIAGLAAGLVGVCVIMGHRLTGGVPVLPVLLCLVAVLALAFAALTVKGASGSGNLLMVVGLQMLVGAVVLGLLAVLFEPWRLTLTPRLIGAFVYTVLVASLMATWVWFGLVGRIGAVRASTFHFLNPFFGVLIAALLLGEPIGIWDIVGVGIVTLGILAVQLSKARQIENGART
ncbi:DMT family transporter [Falsirhodobacter algicola]|uniref:EamA family transporter n=1 Tax=Falsirhodobacter algicola TaxID=2692330 RepID=A0A8J8MTY4_9RHOB|nr:DMT family transporter [Falsirhodobacter algicola]QUS36394.1 EamA family transporter [Falsirhodobacter algicola]